MAIATTDQVGREIDLWTVAVSKLDNLCMGEDSHLGEGGEDCQYKSSSSNETETWPRE